nr:hypothetical protein [Tanacetum cinerariifolium]
CYFRNVVIEINVLNILSDALPIITNGQTATGKESSNPFIAGVNTPRSDEDRLKLMELMVFVLQKGVCVEIGITAARLSSYCCQANKSDAAGAFEQIIDFLSGSYIHYALTVNPLNYISCIKQFWNTASIKRSGDITRLQALVDKKKIVISEVVIREILQLDDAEGVVCLPNEEIFAGLAQMGYEKPSTKLTSYKAFFSSQWKFLIHTILQSLSAKRTSCNEFSTSMDSAVICLSKGQRFNFSKYIFDSLHVENLGNDNAAQKLLIIKLKARVNRLEKANMVKSSKLRRLRKVRASRRVKSSDDMEDVFNQGSMIDDMDKDEGIELVKDAKVAESEGRHAATEQAKKQAEIYNLDLDHSSKVLISAASATILTAAPIVVVAYTRKRKGVIIRDPEEELSSKIRAETPKVPAASATIPAASATILTAAPIVVVAYTRKRKGVIIRDPEEELSSKIRKGILVETPKPIKKKDQIELDAEYARKLHEEINKDEFNKDINWDAAIDHICPIFQARFDENMRFLFKSSEEMEEEDQKIIKSINETLAQKAAKRRKQSEEAQEAKDLRKRLEVVEDEDDDVFVEATPLASKVPVVDYQIVLIDNKPRFKIIRANETHQIYISFTTLLKNFDREDLENLWRIVKHKFSTSKPTNFSDEYLLLTLKTMFEEPDGQDAIWRNQKSVHGLALVKKWKLLNSCGVHVITLSTVQLFLLVERSIPFLFRLQNTFLASIRFYEPPPRWEMTRFPVIHQPPQEMSIQEIEDLKQQYLDEMKCLINLEYRDEIKIDELKGYFNIIPILSTEEPDNSLSIGDEQLDTIPATESDEFIKSNDFSDSNDEFSSTDDDSFSIDNIDYVEASPLESELVSSEVMEIVIPEVGGIDDDILLTIKDDILREKLLNNNLLIAKIEALNDNPTPSSDFMTKFSSTSLNSLLEETNTFDNSLPEFKTFCFDVEEISSGSTTTQYDCLFFKIEPNSRNFTMDVVEDISPTKEPRVYNALPTHPTLQLNLKFKLSSESLFTYVVWIFLPFL